MTILLHFKVLQTISNRVTPTQYHFPPGWINFQTSDSKLQTSTIKLQVSNIKHQNCQILRSSIPQPSNSQMRVSCLCVRMWACAHAREDVATAGWGVWAQALPAAGNWGLGGSEPVRVPFWARTGRADCVNHGGYCVWCGSVWLCVQYL